MRPVMHNIAVVLNEPRYSENIGAAARCCKNMGIRDLILVRPQNLEMEKVLKMATHEAVEVVNAMQTHDTLLNALADFQYAVGTTARVGRQRTPTDTPRQMAGRVAGLSQENRVALVFGSEKYGLTNEDLRLCHAVVNIPTADFSSINLAQSVMILCYEIFVCDLDVQVHIPRQATILELEGLFRHLEGLFVKIGLIRPENPDYWMGNVKKGLTRMGLTSRDVKIARGFCRQMLWAVAHGKCSDNPLPEPKPPNEKPPNEKPKVNE